MTRPARSRSSKARPAKFDLARNDLHVTVSGFKAVREATTLRLAPLTLISGANSSGKSSFMQPLLLMKQTLEAAFDPGPLLLYGPNAKFTDYTQTFSRGKARHSVADEFGVLLSSSGYSREIVFDATTTGLKIAQDSSTVNGKSVDLVEMPSTVRKRELKDLYAEQASTFVDIFSRSNRDGERIDWEIDVVRNRCFLEANLSMKTDLLNQNTIFPLDNASVWIGTLRGIIHVPGLRGNPERAYPKTAVGSTYPGTFETYSASIIANWAENDHKTLDALAGDLKRLGLTWKIHARRVNDASVELLVGRMPAPQQGGAQDLVSIADVGFGVSQTLPVLVALRVATPGQIVYLEQPEIHLHPRAQLALADCLVEAAQRGVKVVAETHSSLLIRAVQTAVAKGALKPELVSMNWFGRDPDSGISTVQAAEIDSEGRLGEWPLDFDDIAQEADWAYLDAVRSSQ